MTEDPAQEVSSEPGEAMRAAVFHGNADLRIEEVPIPTPAPDEVLLRIDAAGICGTDGYEYAKGPRMFPVHNRHAVTGHVGPIIIGHEIAGTVVEKGAEVSGLAVGDVVASGGGVSCGTCRWCRRGKTNLCEQYWTVGLQRNGGMAQYTAIPAATCVAVGEYGLTPDAATLGQPMSIGVHAMRQGRLAPGDTAVVIGVGGIGAFLTYAAAQLGATVVAADLDSARIGIARSLGAEITVDPQATDLVELLGEHHLVPDVIYEVTGSIPGLALATSLLRRGTRLVSVGIQSEPSQLDLRDLTLRELEVVGTNAHVLAADLPEALRLLASRPAGWGDVAPVAITIDELLPLGILPMVQGSTDRIKTLVDPWAKQSRPTAT